VRFQTAPPPDFERLDRRVKTACISFLASSSRSDRSTPQKLLCGSTDLIPACSSLEVSSRIHSTRNFAYFDPRCKLMIVPGCIWVRRAPSRAPTSVISIVCARWVMLSIEILTGNTIFLRGDWRLFNICPDDCPVSTRMPTSYLSHDADLQRGALYGSTYRGLEWFPALSRFSMRVLENRTSSPNRAA
jgi:hypothetical protein